MRPHLLELEAFGAFPGAVRLDLDEIGQSGLVLLCGDTGGGKTTLLDALGFALYGVVPGERQKARDDLRSHHSPASATAKVRLEFTARGRRLRVTRTPSQSRPKRRGDGIITDNPTALLESWDGALWTPLAQRAEDVGHEIGQLLGMDASQFFQVVVLPQGRFAAFLQAEHKEREKLLKQLFHVDRFERAEQWLADRAAGALLDLERAGGVLGRLAARVAQEAGVDAPPDLAAAASWASGLATSAQAALQEAKAETATLLTARTTAEHALSEAQALQARQLARHAALEERTALGEQAETIHRLRAERDAADRARPAQVPLAVADTAAEQAAQAEGVAGATHEVLAALLTRVPCPTGIEPLWRTASGMTRDDAVLRQLADALLVEDGRLDSLAEIAQRAAGEQATDEQAAARADALSGELEHVRGWLDAAPARRECAQQQQASARAAEQKLPAARLAHDQALQQQQVRADLERAEGDRERARGAAAHAEREGERWRAHARQVRIDRVDALIGRLASALVDDTPCPVCGSLSHPEVSELLGEDVSEDAEKRAHAAADAAARAAAAAAGELARLDERRTGLRARLLAAPPDAEMTQAEVERLAGLAAAAEPATAQLAALQVQVERNSGELARLETREQEDRKRSVEARGQAEELLGRLRAELGAGVNLPTRRHEVAAVAQAAAQSSQAQSRVLATRAAAAAAATTAGDLLRATGFPDAGAARDAARPASWSAEATERLDQHRDALVGVSARLVALDVPLAPPAPVADRAHELELAAASHGQAVAVEAVMASRAAALAALVPAYDAAVAVLGPLRESAAERKELADVVAGRGTNRLSMPLSTYVLAARLEEVAEAASQRLSRMSGGRYTLTHSDASRDRRSRAGLGLAVEDGWTGRSRDTATLSGGETFMTALSLALGLADVVTAEAGGRSIDALFVDEGFGTLDAGSLDQVMDVLDELRSGGRLVGVVSHVADLRQRIPAQVRVIKGEAGSRIELS